MEIIIIAAIIIVGLVIAVIVPKTHQSETQSTVKEKVSDGAMNDGEKTDASSEVNTVYLQKIEKNTRVVAIITTVSAICAVISAIVTVWSVVSITNM